MDNIYFTPVNVNVGGTGTSFSFVVLYTIAQVNHAETVFVRSAEFKHAERTCERTCVLAIVQSKYIFGRRLL